MWLASDGEGVARFEHGQWRHYGSADGIPNLTVRSILRVPDGSKMARFGLVPGAAKARKENGLSKFQHHGI